MTKEAPTKYPGLSGKFFETVQQLKENRQIDSKYFDSSKIKLNDYRKNRAEVIDVKILSLAFADAANKNAYELGIDVFESIDAEGKSPTKTIFQMNLFDKKSQNKISEYSLSL